VCNHHYLGGFVGKSVSQTAFVQDKVHHWIADVLKLSKIAEKQPQAAFAALTKSLQCEWQFLQHVDPGCDGLFAPPDVVLTPTFVPAVFGCEVTPHEHLLFSLPVRFGGLGVHYTAEFCFSMLPRLSFRPFMVLGHLKLIAMRRPLFVHIKIL